MTKTTSASKTLRTGKMLEWCKSCLNGYKCFRTNEQCCNLDTLVNFVCNMKWPVNNGVSENIDHAVLLTMYHF